MTIVGFETLNFLHLLHKEHWFSYPQIWKIIGTDKMTVYRYMKMWGLSMSQDYKIKRWIASYLTKLQNDFLKSYYIKE